MSAKRLKAADLFCGAGGTSTGLLQACAAAEIPVELVAVNHWERAIETHAANHPKAAHFCQSLADLDPKKAVPGGKLDLLVASPECTHHSVARGGKPVNDQSRASAYCVHRWCAALEVRRVLIENVPEFVTWGPLGKDGKPLKTGRGKLFTAFVETFRAMGYRVEWRVLNAADYGGATTRRRLFVQAAKGRQPIIWPAPTHEPDPTPGLFGSLPRWRAAREVIDWRLRGASIFNRKRPLSENTLKRIEAGLIKFGGKAAEPFLVLLRGTDRSQVNGSGRSVDHPTPVFGTSGAHLGLCEPFLVSAGGPKVDPRSVDRPANTVLTRDHMGIVEPFVMRACNVGDDNCRNKSLDEPIGTIHASGGSFGIVEPFILPPEGIHRGNAPRSVSDPLQTVTAGRGGGCVVEPFLMHTTHHGGDRIYPTNEPMPCVTGANRGEQAIVEPFTIPYYANGEADSVCDPMRTITTKDRFGLVQPDGARLDILFRMLQPHELAGAMGFPAGYRIAGNRGEQVKQIGNAVEVNQAKALCGAVVSGTHGLPGRANSV